MMDWDHRRRARLRAFVASLSGTSLEYYDFAIYGSAAALVFGHLFFAASDPATGAFEAFASYALGFVARPLGGIMFGRLGDRIGRKRVLVRTLVLVGAATFLIGLVPSYKRIGLAAPACLVLLRFAQGVGVGGEWGGAVLMASEHGSSRRAGLLGSAAQLGPPVGTLLANGVLALLVVLLPEQQFWRWGWRAAFLLSALLVGFGWWLRRALDETPVFLDLTGRGERAATPMRQVLRTHRRELVAAILARVGPDVLYAMFAVFVLAYATEVLRLPRGDALLAVLIGSALQVPAIPLSGWLSDRYGRRRVYAVGAIGGAAWSVAFFLLVRSPEALVVGVAGALLFHAIMYGPQAAFISERFPAALRYSGSSLAYTLAGLIGGAVAPMIFSLLLGVSFGPQAIALYIVACCALTLIGLAMAPAPEV